MNKKITPERVERICQESMFGLSDEGACKACGAEAYGVEPDAFNYTCEECGEDAVCGMEGLLFGL